MKTAMQELKSDLVAAIDTGNKSLEEIKDLRTREACQAVVKITIDNILNRIDTELLEMEKEQMIEFAKLHVEAALKAASEEAQAIEGWNTGFSGSAASVDKDSILNSYPLKNIKY